MIAQQHPRATRSASLREARPSDIPRLVDLNHAAYPELVEANVVWDEAQLRSHMARFPRGQILAESEGAAVGAFSTFVVDRRRDALAPHTWYEMTDHGTFASHDPLGETLYLADIYVHPSAWGKGIGSLLYGGLQKLCVKLRLKRVVGGGRLWGYREHADRVSPEAYVASVQRGELRDRVLGSQIKAGFSVRGVLPHYLKDPRSCDYATLLEWVSPETSTVVQ
jgi:GNAT superfamily N-acetyltransferase